jgi:hypothetical protein
MVEPKKSSKRALTLEFILSKYLKCFGYALIAKIVFRCLMNKFNLKKILFEEPRFILKLAFASANLSGIFNVFRYVLQVLKIKIHSYLELFIAGALSSYALRDLQVIELSLLKVLVYPRAIENLWTLVKNKIIKISDNNEKVIRILNPHRGESVLCATLLTVCVYAWSFEPWALTPSLNKKID